MGGARRRAMDEGVRMLVGLLPVSRRVITIVVGWLNDIKPVASCYIGGWLTLESLTSHWLAG